jgi:predicted regulator of Ras-like GTPase activity (Roadblock/LC7/MglB family)/CheY-like chemotaxis protein
MKRVLVVDDEEDMLWMLQRNLNKGMPDVEILSAGSGEEALAVLSDKSVELVITDINMPGMSGLDLLIEINNRYSETGVIIMTAYPSSAYEREAMMSGSLRFIEKPFDIKEMREIVKDVLKNKEGFQGTISGVDLMDIIQLNGLSHATSALKIATTEEEGMIFFMDGEVVHAICGQITGEDAFFKVLEFQDGSLQNIRGAEPPVVSINKSLESLLFEAAMRSDEVAAKLNDTGDQPTTVPDNLAPGDISGLVEEKLKEELPVSLSQNDEPEAATVPSSGETNKPEIKLETESPASDIDESVLTQTEDIEMTDIQKVLAEFTNIEGVHTACLVGRDGFLLDSIARSGIDAEMIGAIASSGFGSAESMGSQLGQGDLLMTMLEYVDGPVMFAPVGSEAFLVIVADKETNLGWIRLSIKKTAKVIEQAADL